VFFTLAPPFTAAQLVEAQGGNIEPFLYVALLWWLRQRPWAFGVVLALGVLNREFTLYAVPALVVVQLATRETSWREGATHWLIVAVAFVLVRESVQALLPLADLMGPGTRGELVGGYAGSQVANLSGRIVFEPAELPGRTWEWLIRGFPAMIGGVAVDGGISTQGRDWAGPILGLSGLAAIGRAGQLVLTGRGRALARVPAFAWYLVGVGALSAVGYVLSRPAGAAVPRYFLLALMAPVGLSAVWLALEPGRRVRQAVMVLLCFWAVGSGIDNIRYARAFVEGRVPNDMRAAADGIERAGVSVARGGYWVAYELTFLTGERVRVASTDFVRIAEYQRLAEATSGAVPLVTDRPCPGGQPVGPWFLCLE
jgi:hypothetical protein